MFWESRWLRVWAGTALMGSTAITPSLWLCMGSCPKRPRALWMADLSCCGRGGPSFHEQMLTQSNHYVFGANTCTLVRDLTGIIEQHPPPPHLSCAYCRQRRRTCQTVLEERISSCHVLCR